MKLIFNGKNFDLIKYLSALVIIAGSLIIMACSGSSDSSSGNTNPPWYPSLSAFEHYESGRSHVFSQATFGGSYSGNNTVTSPFPQVANKSLNFIVRLVGQRCVWP